MVDFTHDLIQVNDVTVHVVSCGDPHGSPVLLCHGFPETWYSWRHQLKALATSGYRAIAMDWRGYGLSSLPREVADYGSDRLTADLCALLDHYRYERASFVGHDWGAIALWEMARLHPDRVASIYNMSVPFTQPHFPPLERFEQVFADQFFYINYFQPVGVAEAELEAHTREFLRDFLYSASGEGMTSGRAFAPAPREGTALLETLARAPTPLPAWLSEHDVDVFDAAFKRSGFFGPLSFYRNMDTNWRRSKDVPSATLVMPIGFLTGALDPVRFMTSGAAESMGEQLANFRGVTVLDGIGHWVQQEAPEQVNAALLGFLDSLA